MFLTLLFFHLPAVAMLFAAVGIELAVYVAYRTSLPVISRPLGIAGAPCMAKAPYRVM
ncbi:MAG: hypothetical protein WBE79_14965 [Candidatus Cybelea sp.]